MLNNNTDESLKKTDKKNKDKLIVVKICSYNDEFDLYIEKNIDGASLLNYVCNILGIREKYYFGLYIHVNNVRKWLLLHRKILKYQNSLSCIKSSTVPLILTIFFTVKIYPSNIENSLFLRITIPYFYNEIKNQIANGVILCTPEISILLASYALQVKFGNFDEEKFKPGSLWKENLIPAYIIKNYCMTPEMWENKLALWYSENYGTINEVAMLEYLKIAQDLEGYSNQHFQFTMKSGEVVNVYINKNHLKFKSTNFEEMVSWDICDKFRLNKTTLIISNNQNDNSLAFEIPNKDICKDIYQFLRDYSSLFKLQNDKKRTSIDLTSLVYKNIEKQAKEEYNQRSIDQQHSKNDNELRIKLIEKNDYLEKKVESLNDAYQSSEENNRFLIDKIKASEEEMDLLNKTISLFKSQICSLIEKDETSISEKSQIKSELSACKEYNTKLSLELNSKLSEINELKKEVERLKDSESSMKKILLEVSTLQNRLINMNPSPSASNLLAGCLSASNLQLQLPHSSSSSSSSTNNTFNNNSIPKTNTSNFSTSKKL